MKIFAGGVNGAVRACAVATIDPCAVTFVAEDIGFGKGSLCFALRFCFLELLHACSCDARYENNIMFNFSAMKNMCINMRYEW